MKVSIIGAGNGGHALSGYMASIGNSVNLYERNIAIVDKLNKLRKIQLKGQIKCIGKLNMVTSSIEDAIKGTELIMVVTTATAHRELAIKMAPHLKDNQVIVLNPGRTGGALEFMNTLRQYNCKKRIYLAEAQSLVYACRIEKIGVVNVIGVKDRVLLSAIPSSDTSYVLGMLSQFYNCFEGAKSILETSFENIGAIFHPSVVLFNEAVIERGNQFYFYRDMTPGLAHLLEKIDIERIAVAKAYGIDIISAADWVSYAYDNIKGDTLCERMRNNPAYYEILAPTTINCRQITEDVPTGLVPFSELGKAAGVSTPITDAIITICSELLNINFRADGRNLKNLGFENCSVKEIIERIN